MDSRTGKKIRLGRLFNQRSGKTLIVAYSHGVLSGPQPGMKTLKEMQCLLRQVSHADGVILTPGMISQLEDAFVGKERPSLLMHMDFQNHGRAVLPYQEGAAVELACVEDALAAGADGIMTYLYLGHSDSEREKQEIARNARLARACERWGIVMIIEVQSARIGTLSEDSRDPAVLSLACRIAAEIGADIVKCEYPRNPDDFADIVSSCPVPIVLAGGAKIDETEKALEMARNAMVTGAAGLAFGRHIFQSDNPTETIARLLNIVHGEQ